MPRSSSRLASRSRLLAAATEEFAAHGLAGGSVDRIARRARLNKAMIYYHFANKDALYCEVLRSTFEAIGARVATIAALDAPPVDKLAAFVDTFVAEALQRPHFPRMMMREMGESGRHLTTATAEAWVRVPDAFFAILDEGIRQGVFRPVPPLVGFLSIIGPTVLLLASAPARERLARLLSRTLPDVAPADLVADARTAALAVLTLPQPLPPASQGVTHGSRPSRPSVDARHRPARLRRRGLP